VSVVSRSIDLSAPVADVFRFVAAPESYPLYIPAYEDGTILSGEAGQPGMTFRWRARSMGLRLEAEETLVERAEGERVRYRGRMMGVAFESEMETAQVAEGTRLSVTIRYDVPRRRGGRLAEGAIRPLVDREIAQSLEAVRDRFADAGAPELGFVRRVYAVWGRHPALYAAQDWITFAGRPRAIRRRAARALGVGPGARVLEVACGTGRNFRWIEDVIGPSGTLVGFDYSEEMLAAARALADRRGFRNVELVRGDAAVLDVGAEPFDAVLCTLGMSAIPDHRRALARCRAVVRPGGRVVVCDARPLRGGLAALDPVVRAVYRRGAAWQPDRDLVGDLRELVGDVRVEELNAGTFFVATATRS
jgi:SAM-dependent methyltransferase